ncbi:MAG TPA: hypothetical protein VHC20_05185 [Candidatus Paceibacterota bacterium]|nr:hypothetical protein [Candidatus Paceibacterota bacterium]
MLRAIAQILLSFAVIPFYPFAVAASFALLSPQVWKSTRFTFENAVGMLAVLCGALGITALLISIIVDPIDLRRWPRFRWLVLVGLVAGTFSAAVFVGSIVSVHPVVARKLPLGDIIPFIGPVVVAVWNFIRIRKEPNQALEPTSGTVTRPAGAGRAPVPPVAHL